MWGALALKVGKSVGKFALQQGAGMLKDHIPKSEEIPGKLGKVFQAAELAKDMRDLYISAVSKIDTDGDGKRDLTMEEMAQFGKEVINMMEDNSALLNDLM